MCPSDTDSTCQSLWDHTAGTHRLCPSPSWAAVASTQGCAEPILTPTWQGGAAPPPPTGQVKKVRLRGITRLAERAVEAGSSSH